MAAKFCTQLNNFLFQKAWGDVFETLTDEQAGSLIKCMCRFSKGEDAQPEDKSLMPIYQMIIRQIEASGELYLMHKWYRKQSGRSASNKTEMPWNQQKDTNPEEGGET